MSGTDPEGRDPAGHLRSRLRHGQVAVLDGGTGTEVNARGGAFDPDAWSATVNLDAPELVAEVHESFIRAGAEVIITNTFSTMRPRLAAAGREAGLEDAVANAVRVARQAANAAARPVAVGGSIGLPGATLQPPETDAMDYDVAHRIFAEQAEMLAGNGVDFLALEMVETLDRGIPALRAALATGLPVWLGVSCRLTESGEVHAGAVREPGQGTLSALLEELLDDRIWAVLVMHSTLDVVAPALELIRDQWDGVIGAYPHHGSYDRAALTWRLGELSPERLLEGAHRWAALGAQLVGGCCGTGPEHIRRLAAGVPRTVAGIAG
jgi:S-methylmethionine-dependent homocysteine/selenocysteine methylase